MEADGKTVTGLGPISLDQSIYEPEHDIMVQ